MIITSVKVISLILPSSCIHVSNCRVEGNFQGSNISLPKKLTQQININIGYNAENPRKKKKKTSRGTEGMHIFQIFWPSATGQMCCNNLATTGITSNYPRMVVRRMVRRRCNCPPLGRNGRNWKIANLEKENYYNSICFVYCNTVILSCLDK